MTIPNVADEDTLIPEERTSLQVTDDADTLVSYPINVDASASDNADESPLPRLHICRDDEIALNPDDPLYMLYHCQGPNYEAFCKRLIDYANNTALHTPTWGQRPFPLPSNKTTLFFGNSHNVNACFCQYQSEIKSLTPPISGKQGYSVEFSNGAVVEALLDQYVCCFWSTMETFDGRRAWTYARIVRCLWFLESSTAYWSLTIQPFMLKWKS